MACGTAQLKQTTQTSYMFSDYREGGGWGKHHFMLWRTRDTNQKQTKTKQKSRDVNLACSKSDMAMSCWSHDHDPRTPPSPSLWGYISKHKWINNKDVKMKVNNPWLNKTYLKQYWLQDMTHVCGYTRANHIVAWGYRGWGGHKTKSRELKDRDTGHGGDNRTNHEAQKV